MKMICKNCFKEFICPVGQVNAGQGKFCKLRCAYDFRIGKPGKTKGMTWKLSEEDRLKRIEHIKGMSQRKLNIDHIVEVGHRRKGQKLLNRSGEHHWNWQGGKTQENAIIRQSIEYKNWRIAVYKRDNFTCVQCGEKGKKLNADHIKPFSKYPDLRLEISNGRTLCVSCHKKTETYGWSQYHRSLAPNIPDDKFMIVGNGI